MEIEALDFETRDELIKWIIETAKSCEQVVIAQVEAADFYDIVEIDGQKVFYLGTEESYRKWCIEEGWPTRQ